MKPARSRRGGIIPCRSFWEGQTNTRLSVVGRVLSPALCRPFLMVRGKGVCDRIFPCLGRRPWVEKFGLRLSTV